MSGKEQLRLVAEPIGEPELAYGGVERVSRLIPIGVAHVEVEALRVVMIGHAARVACSRQQDGGMGAARVARGQGMLP